MALTNAPFSNIFIENEIKDQLLSLINMENYFKVDTSLELNPGLIKQINRYEATSGTAAVTKGNGNATSIVVKYDPAQYTIACLQNRFDWYDEDELADPTMIITGLRHGMVDLWNVAQQNMYTALVSAVPVGNEVSASVPDVAAFIDAVACLGAEEDANIRPFAMCSVNDLAKIRKAVKSDLVYYPDFVRTGYVGTLNGVDIINTKYATDKTILVGTRTAGTLFLKKDTEVEITRLGNRDDTAANIRKNSAFVRKYCVPACTDATKVAKITLP